MKKTDKLYIIDGTGPFFSGYREEIINWSKIPFSHLESKSEKKSRVPVKILNRFKKFISQAKNMGYNALSIDDIAHIVPLDFYPEDLKNRIDLFRATFDEIIKISKKQNMKVFINTDIMFFNKHIEKYTANKNSRIKKLLNEICEIAFIDHDIDGVIFRIGESDGLDVEGDFISRLVLKNAKQVNSYIKSLIDVFERYDKTLIFRTWTVGIYKIGDLIWNKNTFIKAFEGVKSDNFIISMKYGDTDFYDMLDLNPLFFSTEHKKIIELQTRREREGFGNLPFYVGWQYEQYRDGLSQNKNIMGITVWCQTGGWTKKRDLTFIKNSSLWNELNTFAAISIFRNGNTAAGVLEDYFSNPQWIDFISLYHSTLKKVMYIEGFSEKTIYFRRLRIPPLLWLFWDNVIINPVIISFFEFTGMKKFDYPAVEIKKLRTIGKEIGLREIRFYCDTLKMLSRCRRIMVKKKKIKKFQKQARKYNEKYPKTFNFHLDLSMKNYRKNRLLYRLLLREKSDYRIIDRLLLNGFVSMVMRIIIERSRNKTVDFAKEQAMGIKEIFR